MSLPPPPNVNDYLQRLPDAMPLRIHGRVAAVAGGNITIAGMTAPIGAVCQITRADRQSIQARVVGFQGVRPVLAPLAFSEGVAAGDRVTLTTSKMRLRLGPAMLGRIIDALGNPLDGRPLPDQLPSRELDVECPDSMARPSIQQPLPTGIRAIDGFLTCGLGQRLGIFAGSGVGKSSLLSMLVRGTAVDSVVVGMIGERGREVRDFVEHTLGDEGLQKSVIVVATSDQPAGLRVQAAWTATAVAETLRDTGQNVLLLLDSVTRFALAQREIGLAAGEPPTTRGYPPSVFALLPRLVERAGNTERGSISAFYSVLVEGDDNNEPIADTLRGLLDGHIVLSRQLATQSHWPAIDVLASISRLQSRLIPPDLRLAVEKLRQSMAEYERHADLISIGAYKQGTNPQLDQAIALRQPLRQFLCQATDEHWPLERTEQALKQLSGACEANPAVPSEMG